MLLILRYFLVVKSGISFVYKFLIGMKILIDVGYGSENDLGVRGLNGYFEKNVILIILKLL